MTKRGLLIGCATEGLRGVCNDIAAMSRWLGELGFILDVREGVDATREGIMDGLAQLIRDTSDEDPAVVYFSGHGGHSQVPASQQMFDGRVAPRAVQYLVPTDHDRRDRFRGIFRVELSLAMQRLAEQTPNITVILDCCHSTDMVRLEDDRLKGRAEPWGEGIESHYAWLREQGHDIERLSELRNSSVVLLSACEAARQAFEIARPADGSHYGLFTDCLVSVAAGIPDLGSVSWRALMRRVVERVQQHRSYQRPQVSGPSSRCVFTMRHRRHIGALSVTRREHRWWLEGGEAAGVWPGDRFCIVDPLAGDAPALAEVEASEVTAGQSGLVLDPALDATIESGMVAWPRPRGPVHLQCRIEGEGALEEFLRDRIKSIPGLGLADDREDSPPALTLTVDGDRVQIYGRDGSRLRHPWSSEAASDRFQPQSRIDALVEDLQRICHGLRLLTLAEHKAEHDIPDQLQFDLEWGVMEGDGVPRRLPHRGAELLEGSRVYLAIQNTSHWPVRVSVFDIGVGLGVTLLNASETEGIDLGAAETEVFGASELGPLVGLELRWPANVPRDGPKEESLALFISSDPLPLASWDTSPWGDAHAIRSAQPSANAAESAYYLHHISFRLHPRTNDS